MLSTLVSNFRHANQDISICQIAFRFDETEGNVKMSKCISKIILEYLFYKSINFLTLHEIKDSFKSKTTSYVWI